MLASHNSENIDREIVLTLWPRNWNAVQKLLKENGMEMQNYFPFASVEVRRNKQEMGKLLRNLFTLESTVSWRIRMTYAFTVERKATLNATTYLGVSIKVKNWFKSADMCRKMLSHWKARNNWLGNQSSNPEKCEFWDGE